MSISREYATEEIRVPKTIRNHLVWDSPAKRRRDHQESWEDALARAYSQAYDRRVPRPERPPTRRWDAGTLHKIKLPANHPSGKAELTALWTGLQSLKAYWRKVEQEAKDGVYLKVTY